VRQTSDDFLWLIIDDGSTDNTNELVDKWMTEGKIQIEYHYKRNGGMHSAHNVAYGKIQTELNVCIDSDDFMPDNAVELIITKWRKDGSEKYAGIFGLDVDIEGKRIASNAFPEELKSCKYSNLKKYGIVGDIKFVYRTDVIKKYMPYPEFRGENYLSVGYVYALIDLDYDMLCTNDIYCVVQYMKDGITKNKILQYKRYPQGFAHIRKTMMVFHPSFIYRFRSAIHYISSSIFLKNNNFIKESPNKMLTVAAIPIGLLLHCYITLRIKKNKYQW
jgi:glycosyltransferase involved in cell wall biosynthesis